MEKEIKEITFGAKDSELYKFEYTIPEGYEAEIKDGKVIMTKKESEDERIYNLIYSSIKNEIPVASPRNKELALAYLEKQKENVEKEYVFRPLAGTDITIAAEQSIRKAKDGEHLVLAFNGMYTPVSKYDSAKGLVDKYNTYLEKHKNQDVKVISWREPDDCADIPEGHYVVIAYKPGVFGLGYIGNGKVVCAPGQKPSGILYIPNADESIIVESKEQKLAEWSEEDERMRQTAIEACKTVAEDYENSNARFCKCKGWLEYRLKSLHPQPHWKPSKKQIDALNSIILTGSFTYVGQTQDLISLKDDLEKLM